MNFTPSNRKFQQMRDGILMQLTASGNDERVCMVWDFFAQFGVCVAASSIVRGKKIVVIESFAVPPESV